jgi:sterol desaturase/sphingolipid hydroxylase (fatty acid hydroxylase superfamily)
MFENDVLEHFSRIHPATPFVVWIPVAGFFFARAITLHGFGVGSAIGLFAAGLLAWTLAEYLLHRYVFHWTGESKRAQRIHFLLHGVHHDFPSDKDRLVMPLLTSIPLALIFHTLFTFTMGRAGVPFFSGFVIGYLCYDGTHYAVHHFKQTTRIGKFLRRHHMLHHHADHDGGFGVSTPLWDYVFRTLPKARKASPTSTQSAS